MFRQTNRKIEWAVFIFFVSSLICISYFHELVFNEVQAWALAKGASWKELLFVFPHLEGHPPLWSLILSVPAKLGVPVEWGLKTTAILISSISAWLIIFKMPFPRWVRCLIPFTFFFFYEYSVLARPYGLLILALVLAALSFSKRNRHPFLFVGPLVLLACTHIFGLAISCGIACAWIWEIAQEKPFHFSWACCKDTRLYALGILLIVGIITALETWPDNRAAVSSLQITAALWKQLLYVFLIFPADSLFTSFVQKPQVLKQLEMPVLSLIGGSLAGLVLWGMFLLFCAKKALKYLLFPFVLLGVCALHYFGWQHAGIMAGLFMFGAAVCSSSGPSLWTDCKERFSPRLRRIVEKGYEWALAVILGISVMWTIATCWGEVLLVPVASEKPLVTFLQKHHLEDAVIWSAWERVYDYFRRPNTASVSYGIGLNCYYGRNKIANLNHADPTKIYRVHSVATEEENTRNFANWLAKGYPEIILGYIDWKEVEGAGDPPPYVLIYKIPSNSFHKFKLPSLANGVPVFIREDCMEKYHLFHKKAHKANGDTTDKRF